MIFRTLRMIKHFGDGDRFSQKRLRAPQDVAGKGKPKNFDYDVVPVLNERKNFDSDQKLIATNEVQNSGEFLDVEEKNQV